MASPTEVVRAFCRLVGERDEAGVRDLLDENAVYHNVGMPPTIGREAAVAAMVAQFTMFDPLEFRILNVAADGENVLTERVDVVTANGISAPVPVMGTFVVRSGKIVAWRDYFDMGLTGRLLSGEDASDVLPAI
jgi:limonene-1,2-epoxide hydrolase